MLPLLHLPGRHKRIPKGREDVLRGGDCIDEKVAWEACSVQMRPVATRRDVSEASDEHIAWAKEMLRKLPSFCASYAGRTLQSLTSS